MARRLARKAELISLRIAAATILLPLLVFLLPSIAYARDPAFVEAEKLPDGMALVYVYRVSRLAGSIGRLWAMIGDQPATLPNGSYVPMRVKPGLHSVRCGPKTGSEMYSVVILDSQGRRNRYTYFDLWIAGKSLRSLEFVANANSTYFIEVALNCSMFVRSAEEAKAIRKTKLGDGFGPRTREQWDALFQRCRAPNTAADNLCIQLLDQTAVVERSF